MKKSFRRLSELQASLIITGALSILLVIVGVILLVLKKPGWIIGFAIGSAADFFYIWLMSVGATLALKESKTGLFLLTYFARMAVFVGLFALLVVMQYVSKITVFNNSCWAMLIAFVPVTFITIAIQLMHKDEEKK
jgi:hypothetical protein